ncbi:hypothetical protein UPYG_G00336580 [Umbra pygmaea]|uniref:Uncharacterized protein n=1 Tax=Umbra pygmaea TaxID=75934 RepID=A0ABD0W0D9_UMBPY
MCLSMTCCHGKRRHKVDPGMQTFEHNCRTWKGASQSLISPGGGTVTAMKSEVLFHALLVYKLTNLVISTS